MWRGADGGIDDGVIAPAPPVFRAQELARDDPARGAGKEGHHGGAFAAREVQGGVELTAPELPPERGVAAAAAVDDGVVHAVAEQGQEGGGAIGEHEGDVRASGTHGAKGGGGEDEVADAFKLKDEDAHGRDGQSVTPTGGGQVSCGGAGWRRMGRE